MKWLTIYMLDTAELLSTLCYLLNTYLSVLIYVFQTLKRVRVGIGRPNKRDHVTDYVLSKFEPTEIPVVQGTVEKCCKVLINELQLFMTQSNDTKDRENSEETRVGYHTQQQSVL